jgi:hypothetical protein
MDDAEQIWMGIKGYVKIFWACFNNASGNYCSEH